MDKKEKKCFLCISSCDCDKPKIKVVNNNSGDGYGGNQTVCVGSTVMQGPTGQQGPIGESAFEIAVDNGFTGTQEEWQQSLVGPQGQAPLFGAIIPYSAINTESAYEIGASDVIRSVYFLPFTGYELDVQFDKDDISLFDVVEEGIRIPCFIATKNSTLTGLSCEANVLADYVNGSGECVVKAAVYTSPAGSSIFILQTDTILNLTPIIMQGAQLNVYGTKQFSHPITAGTKVLLAFYVEPLDKSPTNEILISVFGNAWAGLNIKEEL